jgi:integrase/recombinase XerC
MASIIWRTRQRKWFALFYDSCGVKRCKPLPDSVPRREALNRSERRAAEWEAERIADAAKATSVEAMDLESAAAYWIDDCKVSLSPHTAEAYRSRAKAFVRHVAGGKLLALHAVTPQHVRLWRDARLADHSRSTVSNDLKAIGAFFAWCKASGFIATNPAETVLAPRRDTQEQPMPSDADVSRLLALLADPAIPADFRALGLFGALAGMRRNEILSLRWADVNLDGRFLRILISKSKRPRNVPLADPLVQFLMDRPQGDAGYVFPALYGKEAKKRSPSVARDFNAWLRSQGFGFTHKGLRHWCNDSLRRMGLEGIARRNVIGHTTEAVNAIYCHPQAEEARPFLDRLAAQSSVLRGNAATDATGADAAGA